jgi:hypothetical protein
MHPFNGLFALIKQEYTPASHLAAGMQKLHRFSEPDVCAFDVARNPSGLGYERTFEPAQALRRHNSTSVDIRQNPAT